MEITSFALRILVLLLPGMTCALLFEKLTIHRPWTPARFFIYTFLFGAITYLALSALAAMLSFCLALAGFAAEWRVSFWDSLLDDNAAISYSEIGLSVLLAVPISYLASAASSHEWANRIGTKLGATSKCGDRPLYYVELATLGGVLLRCWSPNGLVYEGRVRSLSKEDGFNELTLEDVIVYSRKLEFLYRLHMTFLSLDEKGLIVEIVPNHGADTPPPSGANDD